MYFELTASRKTANTRLNDECCITKYFDMIKNRSSIRYIDEVNNLDIQFLIKELNSLGRSESTLKNAITLTKKVFNWLIDEAGMTSVENPVPRKFRIPKKNGLVRDHLPTDDEVKAILNASESFSLASSSSAPIEKILKFVTYTGCRLGECLHAEWEDFDLDKGVWTIRYKEKCPTKNGLGWSPKWGKKRRITLLPEALDIINSIPKRISVGFVQIRDEDCKIVDRKPYPARFVFPKEERKKVGNETHVFYSRVDSIKTSWNTIKKRSGVQNIKIKDLRTYFNHMLRSRFGFSSKEAGDYLGNSCYVNDMHYTPMSETEIRSKLDRVSFTNIL